MAWPGETFNPVFKMASSDYPETSPIEIHASHVEKLPPELLAVVFFALDDDKVTAHCGPAFAIPRDWLQTTPPAWLAVRLVCRQWDEIVCTTPALWQDIRAVGARYVDWLDLSLQRVGDTLPINVAFGVMNPTKLAEALAYIGRHACRLRILSFPFFFSHVVQQTRDAASVFAAFLQMCPDTLDELRIDWKLYHALGEQYAPGSDLCVLSVRVLRIRDLQGLDLHRAALVRNLRTLDFRGCSTFGKHSLDAFLALLDGSRDTLEEITLYDILPRVSLTGRSQRVVSLHRLKRLVIRPVVYIDSPPLLICQLRIPLITSIELVERLDVRIVQVVTDGPTFPILLHATSAQIHVGRMTWLSCTEPGGGTLQVCVRAEENPAPEKISSDTHLADVCTLLSRAPLNELTLFMRKSEALNTERTVAVFEAFPALQSIQVVIEGEGPDSGETMLLPRTTIGLPRCVKLNRIIPATRWADLE